MSALWNSCEVAWIDGRVWALYSSTCAFCTFSSDWFRSMPWAHPVSPPVSALKLQHSGDWKWNRVPGNRSLLCWPDNEKLLCTTGCCLLVSILAMFVFLERQKNSTPSVMFSPLPTFLKRCTSHSAGNHLLLFTRASRYNVKCLSLAEIWVSVSWTFSQELQVRAYLVSWDFPGFTPCEGSLRSNKQDWTS